LPGSLICLGLTRGSEVDFEDLVGAFERLVDDSGNTKGWEKLKLPMILAFPPADGQETTQNQEFQAFHESHLSHNTQ